MAIGPQSCRHPRPRNTARARLTRSKAESSRWPKTSPSLPRNGVCALSTMICERFAKPFRAFCSISIRRSGTSSNVLVMGSTVTAGQAPKPSACTTSVGRGFPRSPCKATITTSPCLTPSSRPYPILQTRSRHRPGSQMSERPAPAALAGRIPPQSRELWCLAARSVPAAVPRRATCRAGAGPALRLFLGLPCVTCRALELPVPGIGCPTLAFLVFMQVLLSR